MSKDKSHPNFEEDAEQASSSPESIDSLKKVIAKRKQLADLKSELEAKLKETNIEANSIDREVLPEAMKACGLEEFKTEDGYKVTLKQVVQGSIPSLTAIMRAKGEERDMLISRREEAFEYLETHGAGAIIKSSVSVSLPRGDESASYMALKALRDIGLEPIKDDSVHTGQLNSWLKERINSGGEVDFEVLNVYTGETAEIRLGRKKVS